jgi:hypothetical protein
MGTVTQLPDRTINVQRTEVERRGQKNGKPWVMYRVFATELDGTDIPEKLVTFDKLPAGEQTVAVEAFAAGSTVSYTLKKQRAPKAEAKGTPNGGAPVEEIAPYDVAEELASMSRRLEKVERKLAAIIRAEGIDA